MEQTIMNTTNNTNNTITTTIEEVTPMTNEEVMTIIKHEIGDVEAVAKAVYDAVDKIEQKLMYSVKSNQLRAIFKKDGVFYKGETGEDDDTIERFLLVVNSKNPISPYFSLMASNAGMTDRIESPVRHITAVAKRENTLGGMSYVKVDKPMYVNDWEWHIQLNGAKHKVVYMIEEDMFNIINEFQVIPEEFLTSMKPGYSSVSESRKGDSPFVLTSLSRLALLEKSDFRLNSFFKKDRNTVGRVTFDSGKASKRTKLAASSSKSFPLFDGYEYTETTIKNYEKHGANLELVPVESTVYVLSNGEKEVKIEVVDDFEVYMLEELILPLFNLDKSIDVVKSLQELRRLATDGISYVDEAYANEMGLNFASGFQFRFTNVGKGLMLVVPGLKDLMGIELVLFDGCVKGDIAPYIKSNAFNFAILNTSRLTEEESRLQLSRQVITAIQNKEIIDGLTLETANILKKLYNLEPEILKEFIGFTEESILEDVSEEGSNVIEMDNQTVEMFSTNPELFVKSADGKKKLFSLLDASTKKLINGRSLYLKEASIKHMAVDPYAILSFMSKGMLSAVRDTDSSVGIRKNNVIVSGMKNGKLGIEHKKAFLARFPFLHSLEGRVVNNDGGFPFSDKETHFYYTDAMERGLFQGIILYSLWDMNPEAQSGADFDGDTTLYITNFIIANNIKETGLFLDYSLIEQENGERKLVEGCPFTSDTSVAVEEVLSTEAIEFLKENDVTFNNGVFSFDKSLADNRQLLEIFADSMAEMSMANLTNNSIGAYTNLNASVMALMGTLKVQMDAIKPVVQQLAADKNVEGFNELYSVFLNIKEEYAGYKKLSFLMACAIRWEIDKAKHGGAYREHMPFVNAFDGMANDFDTKDEIASYETIYGVSLERLLYGSVSK